MSKKVHYGINLAEATQRMLDALEVTRIELKKKQQKKSSCLPDNFFNGNCHRCCNTKCRFNTTPDQFIPLLRSPKTSFGVKTCPQAWLKDEP